MRRKRRSVSQLHHLQIQQSKIIFNNEIDTLQICSICSTTDNALINPCQCPTKYHERCLLLYIKGVIKRGLRENDELDLSTIKCRRCENQFHIYYTFKNEYSCQVFMKRMEKNCCNRHVVIITLLVIIIIITVTIFINYSGESKANSDKKLMYGLIALLVAQGLILLIIISHFIQSYLLLKQIVLEKVFQIIELRSLASNNSDDNKIGDDYDVLVRS